MLPNEYRSLDSEWRQLERQVDDTRQIWNDSKRSEFEERYWTSLTKTMPSYLEALGNLSETIEHIQRNMP